MTLSLFAIVLGLAIVIAIPLARLIHYLEREMRFRQMMRPVHKAIAASTVSNCEAVKLTGKRHRATASVTEISALTSKRVTTKG